MNLPDIIEWLPPRKCTFCGNPAVCMYMSDDGEQIYTCRAHSRTHAIQVDFPEHVEAMHMLEDGFLEVNQVRFKTKVYKYIGVLA